MNRSLIDTLAQTNKPTATWTGPDGSVALLLPYGGRVLGLFPPGSGENFFWTHPALDSLQTARAFYQSTGWHNSGGDRTWFAPEVDFFFPNYPSLDAYWQPREFDPGNYQVTQGQEFIALTNAFTYTLSRSKKAANLIVKKRLASALNPLRHYAWAADLQYAGYTLRTSLAFNTNAFDLIQVGIWSLLQLPHRGEFLMPTYSKVEARTLMGSIDSSDLSVSDHLVRYKMRAVGEHKLGFEAPALAGRIGYLHRTSKNASLVIRNFQIDPSGEYIDVPWKNPESPGSAVEACNVNGSLGQFSEIEYHAPAIGGCSGGQSKCEDRSQLWAFRGNEEDILRVARVLIDSEI